MAAFTICMVISGFVILGAVIKFARLKKRCPSINKKDIPTYIAFEGYNFTSNIEEDTYGSYITVVFEEGVTYCFGALFEYDIKYTSVFIKENTGENFEYPLEFNEALGNLNIDFTNVDGNEIYVKYTPVTTTSYDVKVTEGYKVLIATSETYQSGALNTETKTLAVGPTYYIKITKDTTTTNNNLELQIATTNAEKDGSTILNGIEVIDGENTLTIENETTYYEYTNDNDVGFKSITLDISDSYSYKVYDNEFNEITNTSTFDYRVKANEKIYIEVVNNGTLVETPKITINDIKLNEVIEDTNGYETTTLSESDKVAYYKFVALDDKFHGINGILDNASLQLYDSELNKVNTYIDTNHSNQHVTNAMLEKGKTYYIRVELTNYTEDTPYEFTVSYGTVSLYRIVNDSFYPYEISDDGTTLTLYADSFTADDIGSNSLFQIIADREIRVSFDYEVSYMQGNYEDEVVVYANSTYGSEYYEYNTKPGSYINGSVNHIISKEGNVHVFYTRNTMDYTPNNGVLIKITNLRITPII